jgi:hypothetical protein
MEYPASDGALIRSKGLDSAAKVTPAQARRARQNFAVAPRSGVAAEALQILAFVMGRRKRLPDECHSTGAGASEEGRQWPGVRSTGHRPYASDAFR